MVEENLVEKIKVLLVEDNDYHVELSDFPTNYEVTHVETFAEAARELYGIEESGYINTEDKNPNNYQMLLTDMNFQVGEGKVVDESVEDVISSAYQRSEIAPLGWPLAMIGAQVGLSYIGMFTDTNHHAGPMALAVGDNLANTSMKLDNSTLAIWDIRSYIKTDDDLFYAPKDDCMEKPQKNYAELARYLTSQN